jgi:uncharacterized repeat protein (TIGR03803 family)
MLELRMVFGLSKLLVGAVVAVGLATAPASAGTFTTLYQFTGGADGATPRSALAYDEKGNLYGTAEQGGDTACPDSILKLGCGTVFEISPTGQETTLVTFTGDNGSEPIGPLTLINHVLYGSTSAGGESDNGVLFSVRADGKDFKLLHVFNGKDGHAPLGPLVPGPNGVFYGITSGGGPHTHIESGVMFELTADDTYIQLHDFTGKEDGGAPSSLTINAQGTLFGGTNTGGSCRPNRACGVVFEYVPATGAFTVLQDFTPATGIFPMVGSLGPDGTVYGATGSGGQHGGGGSLFEFTPAGDAYTFSTLYWFRDRPDSGGCEPSSGPVLTKSGALIGATGGCYASLYKFDNNKAHALYSLPNNFFGQPALGHDGTIYGATSEGGNTQCTINGEQFPAGCGFVYSYVR